MELTEENKQHIDNLSYKELLRHWRFAPAGDPWFEGETGQYWSLHMSKLKNNTDHVTASKAIGLER